MCVYIYEKCQGHLRMKISVDQFYRTITDILDIGGDIFDIGGILERVMEVWFKFFIFYFYDCTNTKNIYYMHSVT